MPEKPFWETAYRGDAAAFGRGPTKDIEEFYPNLKERSEILDVGCGEGRNAIFLAKLGHTVDAFDLSEAGVVKATRIAESNQVEVNFFVCDLGAFEFEKDYDAVLSHGVLHLPEKAERDAFIEKAKACTRPGGYNIIGVFTDRLPATPDNAPFTKSLFKVGELPGKYGDWEILRHFEGTFSDEHPGGARHEHAYERIVARKPQNGEASAHDEGSVWYHGSNMVFDTLREGSTVTRWRELAEAFSRKPTLLSCEDDGSIRHNGREKGYLYVVDEAVEVGRDVYPHPRSSMEEKVEYLTKRPLRVKRIEQRGTKP
jgi:tellurite methyltransferase